jgi:chitin synthase
MYRLKARKQNDGDWFPVLVQPQIVSEYSQSVVTTLHQKNLLLLGEDRFLTTLLLRTFPNRKMMFCPQARCRTVAPDTFAVLLSQRRRWINSTVHNLMELVLVRNLCGTFVFSMQFVVFVDLIGTVVLPVAICLTYTLIINYIFNPPASFSDAIPLMLLGAVLGLPAILILITSFKIVYVGWMLIYLIALPIWNFVLPVYAFSKFDDFSWGETRKVEGDVKGEDAHGIGTGTAATVPLRRWEDWERSRLRTAKRRKEFERRFGSKHFYGGGTDGASSYEDSVAPTDSGSIMSHDDDMWGMQIGAYTEDGPTAAPPPVGLYNVEDDQFSAHETIDASDLEAALEQGWAEDPSDEPRLARRSMGNSMGNLMGSSSRGDSYYHTNSGSNTPPAPPKLYSLSDGPLMSSSYSNSSQQALVGNPASYSTSSFAEYAPGPMSPNGSTSSHPVYPQHSTMQMGNYPPGMSTSVSDRNFSGGHAKQRSGSNEMNFERRERGTPSPSRERQFERDAQYHQQQGYGQGEGRRLA